LGESPDDLVAAMRTHMRWNTPLSQDHADLLLSRLDVAAESHVLDLGCGWGELLIQAVARLGPSSGLVHGTGVETDTTALARASAS